MDRIHPDWSEFLRLLNSHDIDRDCLSEVGEKWAFFALYVPHLALALPVGIDEDIQLEGSFNNISDHWKQGLGRWRLKQIDRCNLFIVSRALSAKPRILDDENNALEWNGWNSHLTLILVGVKVSGPPYSFQGADIGPGVAEDGIRSFTDRRAYRHVEGCNGVLLNKAKLDQALRAFAGLKRVTSLPSEYVRFNKGFRSLIEATLQPFCVDRTYFFVRALEALHATQKSEGKKDFVDRCQLFTGSSPEFGTLFQDLYDTRNNVVHVNGSDSLSKNGEDTSATEARIIKQAIDVELIAKEVYRLILSDPNLLAHFRDDGSIRAWWSSSPVWTDLIDPAAIGEERSNEISEWHENSALRRFGQS